MTSFLIGAALLVLLALAFVLPPLWRQARLTALALLLVVPVMTLGLYHLIGEPEALDPANIEAPTTLEGAIAQLERRLADEPGSVEGWVLLGRSRMAQQRWTDARDAFAKAYALLPNEPDLMVEYADAQMRAAPDGRFPDSATRLLEQVVAAVPTHQRGLFFLGAQRLQAGQPAEAAETWGRLLPLLEPQTALALRPQLDQARELAGLPPLDDAALAAAPVPGGPTITVTVALDPALAADVGDDDVLYVFARTTDGAGLPVAVKRLPASGFPLTVTLSDADGLMPAQKLSMQSDVRVLARISKSGDAAAAAGDLEATAVTLAVADDARAELVIDKVKP
ncbi:MAG TPA: cytochrome C biogenesis protein [Arenimonas sp.]|uniref:tetratricopeptide repeat protein n=1 Tax=Arenimonas sp. TaxID=1872635 RepID=UPI002D7F58A2|nr:cytochrome C biogenesis protein [Arenimonas sp.]HEU0153675.1 cytochrome C biogenesis protein [Arenimonas sp.]